MVDKFEIKSAIEHQGVKIVDVGQDPTDERMAALDQEATRLGGVRRIAPSVYVLWPKFAGRMAQAELDRRAKLEA